MSIMPLIIAFFMLATLTVLITGVSLMMKGGKTNKKYANKLMIARVSLQGATLLLVLLMFLAK